MQIQPRYDAYRESTFFEDGSAMRAPPHGTRPFSTVAENTAITEGTVDGHDVETIPVAVTPELLARGRAQFEIVCAACHGAAGDGNSIPAHFMERKPPSFTEERLRVLPDGRIFKIVGDGYGAMPSYATHLDVQDRWAVVAFVRALERSRHAVVARLPDDIVNELRRRAP
jgi:mono/diheme cytochrome c family protein